MFFSLQLLRTIHPTPSPIGMRRPQHLTSTAQALYRVFIGPIETLPQKTPLLQAQRSVFLRRRPEPRWSISQLRQFTFFGRKPNDRPPRDEEITAGWVQVVNAEKGLDPPTSLRTALARIDRKQKWLVQVARPAKLGDPAICKIMDKKVVRGREEQKRKQAKASQIVLKEMELNWSIDAHDLGHRCKKIAQFMERGWRVNILIITKKRKRPATVQEGETLLSKIRNTVELAGGKQRKPMEGKLLRELRLFFEGKPKKVDETVSEAPVQPSVDTNS